MEGNCEACSPFECLPCHDGLVSAESNPEHPPDIEARKESPYGNLLELLEPLPV